MNPLIGTALEPDGVLVATIDMPDRTMNVFSAELIDALDQLMDRVDADPQVRSVVITSGKRSFLAGADLAMVRGFTKRAKSATADQMFELCGRLGRQFVRLEASAKPWVAAVNGIALGGGLELALACRTRLVANDPRIQLGVPEVRLGLLPGAGGTQRLPRLAGFEAAMDLLLSGRSIAPADAVRLGIFAAAVAPAHLLDQARAAARAWHGTAFDVRSKYAAVTRDDLPAGDAAAAIRIAARHGIGEDAFSHYPAYRAIIDSVLQGAHLPLADATAVEMTMFLRLMFDPVAGRMVRTLFLERLRAERELGAPAGVRIEGVAAGAISPARQLWRDALDKLKRPAVTDPALPPDTLELIGAAGDRRRILLRGLDEAASAETAVTAVLAPAGPYGGVMEIIGADPASAAALAAFAPLLGCLPWGTPGPVSVLQQLRGQALPAQAVTALLCAAQAGAGEPAFLDVAACLAGITPAWTGGPLTWLWAEQSALRAGFDAPATAAWARVAPRLQQAGA